MFISKTISIKKRMILASDNLVLMVLMSELRKSIKTETTFVIIITQGHKKSDVPEIRLTYS